MKEIEKINIKKFWEEFKNKNNINCEEYDFFAFGVEPDTLANLVKNKIKTATTSLYYSYLKEKIALPKKNGYSIVLNSKNEPVCIIKNIDITIKKFNEVDEIHAYKEGEGDKTLDYWRKVHKEFFENELKVYNKSFNENIELVLEEFELVYIKE